MIKMQAFSPLSLGAQITQSLVIAGTSPPPPTRVSHTGLRGAGEPRSPHAPAPQLAPPSGLRASGLDLRTTRLSVS